MAGIHISVKTCQSSGLRRLKYQPCTVIVKKQTKKSKPQTYISKAKVSVTRLELELSQVPAVTFITYVPKLT